ncbi:MAG: glycosyltransferase family 2 protein [Bacteroidota bacterium]
MLSIIIVNYRSWDHLSNCLHSLELVSDLEVIVVDNDSADGKIEEFKTSFPKVNFIDAKQNLGFGAACNLGAKHAKANYLLFLNPDTVANKTSILEMKDFLQKNEPYKIVSCKQTKNIKGHFLLFPNLYRMFGLLRAIEVFFSKKKFETKSINGIRFIEPDWVSGSVLMTSKAWLNEIGGWSKEFWMYSEDLEICKKTADKNGKMALLTEFEIYHKHGGSTRKNIVTAAITKAEVIKSKHVYIDKHFNDSEKYFAHSILVFSFFFFKMPLAILGLIFFFIPKMRLQTEIFKKLFNHYLDVLRNGSWLSDRLIKIS